MTPARWRATFYYRTAKGTLDVEHAVEELDEIADIVESGPHWDTIERIVITLARPSEDITLTIEQAEAL